jgi:hypothetical protein
MAMPKVLSGSRRRAAALGYRSGEDAAMSEPGPAGKTADPDFAGLFALLQRYFRGVPAIDGVALATWCRRHASG